MTRNEKKYGTERSVEEKRVAHRQNSLPGMQLANKTILILGGAGLLGSEISRMCSREGAHAIIVDTNNVRGLQLATDVGGTYINTDITNEKKLIALKKTLEKKFGTIDGIVHAAYPRSKNYGASVEKASAKELFENIEGLLGGPLISTRTLMPLLSRGASVIFFSSLYGIASPRFEIYKGTNMIGVPSEYAAAKAGVLGLMLFFAAFLGKRSIRVNTITPGGILDNQPKRFIKAYSKKTLIPPGMLEPKDIGGAAVFLLSDASKKITGQNIVVDGGWTL